MRSNWTSALPSPLCDDPHVVVVYAPEGANFIAAESPDGATLIGLMKMPYSETYLGLQVLRPRHADWPSQERALLDLGVRSAAPVFIGRLSDLPDAILNHPVFAPLVFMRDDPGEPFFNLRNALIKEDTCN